MEQGKTLKRMNHLISEINAAYHDASLRLGISDSVCQILYTICNVGDRCLLSEICAQTGLSKQTINSALKVLGERGLVELSYVEGSRKSKQATLTENGRTFSRRHILPAIRAEERAFSYLSADEQQDLIRLVRRYTDALDAQLAAVDTAEGESR